MKRTIMIAVIMLTALLLAGCESGRLSERKIAESIQDNNMFFTVSIEEYGEIVVCKQTGVMYWLSTCPNNCVTLTLLVDADGKPMIWKR